MMKYVLLLLVPITLFADIFEKGTDSRVVVSNTDNATRRSIFMQFNVNGDQVLAQLGTAAYEDSINALVHTEQLAMFDIPDASVTVTTDQITSGSDLNIPLSFSAFPNPALENGYQVQFEVLAMRINLDTRSTQFYRFQAMPLIGSSSPLYFEIQQGSNSANRWLSPPQGILVSDDWDNSQVIIVADSFGNRNPSVVNFNLKIPNSELQRIQANFVDVQASEGIPELTLWATCVLNMSPYSTSDQLENLTEDSLTLQRQANSLNNQINAFDVVMGGNSGLHRPSDTDLVILNANRDFVVKELTNILNDNLTYWTLLERQSVFESFDVRTTIQSTLDFINDSIAKIPALSY